MKDDSRPWAFKLLTTHKDNFRMLHNKVTNFKIYSDAQNHKKNRLVKAYNFLSDICSHC